jgi:rSAM/selenodomain-associated transferase 2
MISLMGQGLQYGTADISVVIPTLNESLHLPALLNKLASAPNLIAAIIVSDGGSTDATVTIAADAGATLVQGAAGRGGQLRRGIARASTPWLLLLHADSTLLDDWPAAIRPCLSDPTRAHYGLLRFHSADPRARVIEAGVRLRCAWLCLPYGDQGLLIHRDLLDQVGGVPDLPLMEDVALARLLGRRRLASMKMVVTTDASAYIRDGWFRRAGGNIARVTRFYAGLTTGRTADYRR